MLSPLRLHLTVNTAQRVCRIYMHACECVRAKDVPNYCDWNESFLDHTNTLCPERYEHHNLDTDGGYERIWTLIQYCGSPIS